MSPLEIALAGLGALGAIGGTAWLAKYIKRAPKNADEIRVVDAKIDAELKAKRDAAKR